MPPQQSQSQTPGLSQEVQELQRKVEDLLKRMEKLEAWEGERKNQQLVYPLDYVSQQILVGSLSGFTGTGTYTTFQISSGLVVAAS